MQAATLTFGYHFCIHFSKGNWGHRNEPIDLDNSDFPDDGHVNDSRACVLSCFDGDLENEIGDDLIRQVDKIFTKIPTMNIENSQRISDSHLWQLLGHASRHSYIWLSLLYSFFVRRLLACLFLSVHRPQE
jgi:hypothetical protein